MELDPIKISKATKKRKSFINNRIRFEKPDYAALNKQGFMCVDMHMHSNVSDGNRRPTVILKKAQKYGFGVALTDHNAVRGSIQIFNKKLTNVIPAIEVAASNKRDFLLYFYERDELIEFYEKHIKHYRSVDPNTKTKIPMDRLLNVASDYNCIITAAHPFGYVYKNLFGFLQKKYSEVERENFINKFNAIEVINGTMTRAKNLKAIKWAIEQKKLITAGSDGHTLGEIGSVATVAKADSIGEFLDQIKKNKNIIIGRESRIKSKMGVPLMIQHHFKHYPVKFKDKTMSILKGKKIKRKLTN